MVGSSTTTVKLIYSYGGKILPRYHGGHTRVLSVDRPVSFVELMVKLGELCGASVSLRCQLPSEDLDALVSITCDEDLANLIEEYDKAAAPASSPSKIRAFLSPPKSAKKAASPPPSVSSSSSSPSVTYSGSGYSSKSSGCPAPVASKCYRSWSPAQPISQWNNSGEKLLSNRYQGSQTVANGRHVYLLQNGKPLAINRCWRNAAFD